MTCLWNSEEVSIVAAERARERAWEMMSQREQGQVSRALVGHSETGTMGNQ